MTTEEVLELLQEVTETSDGWKALCPAHDDHKPSLTIKRGDVEGVTLLKCWSAQCSLDEIIDALGLKKGDLSALKPRKSEPKEEYVYQDEHGEPLTMVRRYGDKHFVQLHWEAEDGKWLSGVKGARKVPYHLPELLAGVADGRVIMIVEGEKDCDRLRSLRMEATCNAGGGGKGEWKEWAAQGIFDGSHVALVPDNDEVGRKHVNLVAKALFGHAADIRIVTLPVAAKGDASDYLDEHSVKGFIELVQTAPLLMEPPEVPVVTVIETRTGTDLTCTGNGYEITKSVGRESRQVKVSDFEFDLLCVIVMEEARIFEVEAKGKNHQVPSDLFSSMPRFKKWCNGRGLEWSGDQAALDGLYSLLNNPLKEVPQKQGVTATGLHKTEKDKHTWVFSDGAFGDDAEGVTYVRPKVFVEQHYSIAVNSTKYAFDVWSIELLSRLHHANIMTPILGWFAAAPLRSLMINFPPLNVTGASGNGKTTIIRAAMDVFGYWDHKHSRVLNLVSGGALTEHGVRGVVASSVSFPVWFDEYRGSTPYLMKQAIAGVVQSSWDLAGGARGGMGEDLSRIETMAATAPLIVTGEDDFSEKAQIERIVLIEMPGKGKNKEALTELYSLDYQGEFNYQFGPGLGRRYLDWLLDGVIGKRPLPGQGFGDRADKAVEIVQWGYALLQEFCWQHDELLNLPAFDSSLARSAKKARQSPLIEALHEAHGAFDADSRPVVWSIDGHDNDDAAVEYWCVRVGALVKWTEKNWSEDRKLAGGSQAVAAELRDKYEAVDKYTTRTDLWKGRYLQFVLPDSENGTEQAQ